MRAGRVGFYAVVAVACLMSVSSTASATTFALMDDDRLFETSAAVLIGTVTAIESAATPPDGSIHTYIHIQPNWVIKGRLGSDAVVLREPGGTVGGQAEWVFGAPEFWVGERSLLFLSRNADGTMQTNSLSMGKFVIGRGLAGELTAVRDFGYGATVLVPESGQAAAPQPETRPLLPVLRRLRALARRRTAAARNPTLQLQPAELATAPTEFHEAFTFMSNPPARWFEPDSRLPVNYVIDSTGDATLGFAASRAAVDAALAAWTNVSGTSLVLADNGTTAPSAFGGCTGNHITFNDPFNEVTDPSNCGGVVAIGGYCMSAQTSAVNGMTFNRIMVAKVTVNNGWGACPVWNQCNLAEVLTHEIGHTIGLGHSADASATMNATAHFDGRCAGLAADDIAAVNFIYPQSGAPNPTPTPTPTATNVPASSTPTATRVATNTRTPAATSTPTLAATGTRTPPATNTRTLVATSTRTPVATRTRTPTATSTRPPAATATRTAPPLAAALLGDACAAATIIPSAPYASTQLTTAATVEFSDPSPRCGTGSRNKSVWYRFTAPTSGVLVANTFGSSYDTILSVYTGLCGFFTPITGGCNDDTNGKQSQVSFTVTAGKAYYFMVSAPANDGGPLVFNLTLQR